MDALKSRLAEGYSRTAPLYDAIAGPFYAQGLRRLLPRVRPASFPAILDVGCGTGVNLVEAVRWFGPPRLLCGIDLSVGMLEIARTKTAKLGLQVHLTAGDAERLPYPDGLFDLVLCNSVLHWFSDKAAAIREMRRVLRPGGQLVLICAAAPAYWEWFGLVDRLLAAAIGRPAPSSRPPLPTLSEVALWLATEGLLTEHLANPTRLERIRRPEAFVKLMSIIAPHWTSGLPEEVRAAVETTAAATMRCWPQGFRSTWSAVEAIATRLE